MKVGCKYRLRDTGLRQWRKLAYEVRRDPDALIQRVRNLTAQLSDHVSDIRNRMEDEGLTYATVTHLSEALTRRASLCQKVLTR
jgi:hypothetical protein